MGRDKRDRALRDKNGQTYYASRKPEIQGSCSLTSGGEGEAGGSLGLNARDSKMSAPGHSGNRIKETDLADPSDTSSKAGVRGKEKKERERPLRRSSVAVNETLWSGVDWIHGSSKAPETAGTLSQGKARFKMKRGQGERGP